MRISKTQARENRERVIGAAAKLFREKGFDGVAVADLMRAAGMTHGGFYNHFGSKEALEAEACGHVFDGAIGRVAAIAEMPDAAERAQAFALYRRRYVSKANRDKPAPACPMVAFGGDMARRPAEIRERYAEGLATYLEAFTKASGEEREAAIRDYAMRVGALMLARGVAEAAPELSEEILRAVGGGD